MPDSVNGKFWRDLGGVDEEFSAANMNRLRPGAMAYKNTEVSPLTVGVSPVIWVPSGVVKEFPGNVLTLAASDTHYVYLDAGESGALRLKSQTGSFPAGDVFYVAVVVTDATEITSIKNVLIDIGSVSSAGGAEQAVIEQMSTGRVEFDGITRQGGLVVEIGAGRGYLKSGPPSQPLVIPATLVAVTWTAGNVTLPDDEVSYLFITGAGVRSFSSSLPDPEQNILVGTARTHGGEVAFLSFFDIDLVQKVSDNFKYMRDVMGPVLSNGVLAEVHGAPSLQFKIGSGVFYIAQDRKDINEIVGPASFTYWYRDGSGGWVAVPSQTTLDDANYDDGSGTLAAIPAGQFKNDMILVSPLSTAGAAEVHVIYGQETLVDEQTAATLVSPSPPGEFLDFAFRTAIAAIEEGAGLIATLHDVRPRIGVKSVAGTIIVDHGLLGGLSDDDHPQYQLRSEKGAANGYAALDGSALIDPAQVPPPKSYHATEVGSSIFSTSSATYVDVMTISPAPGTYFVMFSAELGGSNSNGVAQFGVGLSTAPGTVTANTPRVQDVGGGAGLRHAVCTHGRITLVAGQALVLRLRKVSGTGTIDLYDRSLTAVKVST